MEEPPLRLGMGCNHSFNETPRLAHLELSSGFDSTTTAANRCLQSFNEARLEAIARHQSAMAKLCVGVCLCVCGRRCICMWR